VAVEPPVQPPAPVERDSPPAPAPAPPLIEAPAPEEDAEPQVPPAPEPAPTEQRKGILCKVNLPESFGEGVHIAISVQEDPAPEPPISDAARGEEREDIRASLKDDEALFTGLKPGRWRVVVGTFEKVLAWKDVILGDELLIVTLEVPEPEANDYIVARVYAPTGELVRDVRFSVGLSTSAPRGGGRTAWGPTTVIRRPDGSVWIGRRQPSPGEVPLHYEVSARSKEFGKLAVQYEFHASHEIEFRFTKPALVNVVVPGFTDHRLTNRITVQFSTAKGEGWGHVSVPKGGKPGEHDLADTFKCGPHPPGDFRVQMFLKWDPKQIQGSSFLGAWVYPVAEGENTLTCAIPPLHKLTVCFIDPSNVGEVRLRSVSPERTYNQTIFAAYFSERTMVEGVPDGEWILSTDEGEMRVLVNGDLEVNFTPVLYDCVRIWFPDKGRIAALGLRPGDIVVRVDGKTPIGALSLRKQMDESLEREATTWTVLREDAEVEVGFSGTALKEATTATYNREFFILTNRYR
jgi:hypothetical protein